LNIEVYRKSQIAQTRSRRRGGEKSDGEANPAQSFRGGCEIRDSRIINCPFWRSWLDAMQGAKRAAAPFTAIGAAAARRPRPDKMDNLLFERL
jgi:hypothetical protein